VPAEFENGFFVRKPAWHGLGTVLPDYVEREEAFRLSGQDWTVERWEVLARKDANSPRIEVPGSFAAVRSDTHAPLCLHQDSYEVLQNTEGWDLAEAVADQDAAVQYETGITLKGGRVCAILLRDQPFSIGGDDSPTVPYTLISWAHDGSAAMTVHATNVRVVCSNTLSLALKGGTQRFSFRHTKNVRDRIEKATAAISQMRTNTELYRNLANYLAKEPIGMAQLGSFTTALFPDAEPHTPQAQHKQLGKRTKVINLVRSSRTIPDDLRFTKYGLLQAGVEYLDWSRNSRSDENRFARTYLAAEPEKARLLELVVGA
jgi:phage/plasmid-like protein (TIGR03299 family)